MMSMLHRRKQQDNYHDATGVRRLLIQYSTIDGDRQAAKGNQYSDDTAAITKTAMTAHLVAGEY